MRHLLAAAFLIAAATAQAAPSLTMPASPGRFATVMLHNDSGTIPLNIPPDYPLDGSPAFGFSGDVDDNVALIGTPEAWWEGTAFLYDNQTGDYLRRLRAGEPLGGGPSRPRFGHDVLLWQGLAIVSAPNAGGDTTQNRGAVFVFNPATGAKLQTIWGPDTHWGLGQELGVVSFIPYATMTNRMTGATQYLQLAIVPEPGAAILALYGVAAGCCRRQM